MAKPFSLRRTSNERSFNTRRLALAGSVAFLTLGPFDGVEAQNKQELERIERQIETQRQERQILNSERRALDKGVSSLRRNLIRAARTAQEHEAVLSRLEDKLPELEEESKIRSAALQERRRQMTGTLAALERLSRNPPQALLLSDAAPVNIVRNAILLRAADLTSPCRSPQKRAFRNSVHPNGIGQSATRDQSREPNACFRAKSSERFNGTPCR